MNSDVSPSEVKQLISEKAIVWAKLRGYPWWPGRIKTFQDCPEELASIAKSNFKIDSVVPVYFFGSHDYSLVSVDCLRPYHSFKAELSGKSVGKSFRRALVEAENPDKFLSYELAHKTANSISLPPVKRKRGRPSKSDMEKQSTSKNDESTKRFNEDGTLSSDFLMYCRIKLQKILLRTSLKFSELEIAVKILDNLYRSNVNPVFLLPTKICRVIRLGLIKHSSTTVAQNVVSSMLSLLKKWRIDFENIMHNAGL